MTVGVEHLPSEGPAGQKHQNCGCVKVCRDVVKMLAQDRKFIGIGLGLTALKVAYRATGKSFDRFCFVHLRLLVSTATGMRNFYHGADFDSTRSRLTTYLKHRNNIPMLRKRLDWFCTELQNNSIRLQLGSNVLGLVPDRGRVTDHLKADTYFIK